MECFLLYLRYILNEPQCVDVHTADLNFRPHRLTGQGNRQVVPRRSRQGSVGVVSSADPFPSPLPSPSSPTDPSRPPYRYPRSPDPSWVPTLSPSRNESCTVSVPTRVRLRARQSVGTHRPRLTTWVLTPLRSRSSGARQRKMGT